MVLILPRIPVFALLHWHQSQKFYIFFKIVAEQGMAIYPKPHL
jgi:hypothetical protein